MYAKFLKYIVLSLINWERKGNINAMLVLNVPFSHNKRCFTCSRELQNIQRVVKYIKYINK